MADEETGINLWKAVAEFFCMLTPQQYIVLPGIIANSIFCSTGGNERFLIADFFSLLGQALATIASQPGACKAIFEARQEKEKEKGKTKSTEDTQAEAEQTEEEAAQEELETGARANPAEENIAHALLFE